MSNTKKNFLEFRSRMSYEHALKYQSFLATEGCMGLLAFVTDPVITLGKSSVYGDDVISSLSNLKKENIEVLRTDRGGKAMYHGPGQLLGFPIINLNQKYASSRSIKSFVNELLLGVAHACSSLGVKGIEVRTDKPGVWTRQGKKIASIGISIRKGYVYHGFSINVMNECLSNFHKINPCGMSQSSVTSLEAEGISLDKISNMENLTTFMSTYLENLFSKDEDNDWRLRSFDQRYSSLIDRIDKSSVAMDYFLLKDELEKKEGPSSI